MKVVEADLLELPLPRRPYRVASPPYALAGPLLRRLVAPGSRLVAADLVLERTMVAYYTGGRRRHRWERTWSATRGPNLPRRAFTPVPGVDPGTLRLRRR